MTGFIFSMIGIGLMTVAMMWDSSKNVAMMWNSSNICMFLNLPSLIIVMGGTLTFTFAAHSPTRTLIALTTALSPRQLSLTESLKHQSVISTARLLASASGVIGTMIGLVHMLARMDNPSAIGPAMAVALLSILYGVTLAELFFAPLINRLKNHTIIKDIKEADMKYQGEELKISMVTLASVPLAILCFFVLLNSMSGS